MVDYDHKHDYQNNASRSRMRLALLGSALVHVALVALVVPLLVRQSADSLLTLECPLRCPSRSEPVVELQVVELSRAQLAQLVPEPPADVAAQTSTVAREEAEPEEEEEQEREPLPEPPPPDHYMVHLEADEEVPPPEDTPYLAQDNNRTDREMQAEITTLVERPPGEELSEAPDAAEVQPDEVESSEPLEAEPEEVAPAEAESEAEQHRESEEVPRELALHRPEPRVDASERPMFDPNNPNGIRPHPRPLDLSAFNPTLQTYRETAGARDAVHRDRIARSMRAQGTRGAGDRERWERTRAALENMVPEVRSGTETQLNTRRHAYAEYLTYVHRRIHARWADDFLIGLDLRFDPTDPLSNPDLTAVMELVIETSGDIVRVNVVRTSGHIVFDAEAIDILYGIGPLRPPPEAIVSDNGNAYLHWTFWRDQRQCGTFGASVHRVAGDVGL